jgi:hypothetical protein
MLLMFERWNCCADGNNFTQNIFVLIAKSSFRTELFGMSIIVNLQRSEKSAADNYSWDFSLRASP